ncbi:TauD/TfdA family dioxygenase [Ferrovibrio sp.]|uniref:TauD/TfdA dioxygenase family protein n=1 Tax=Ferrovibrio sp. TaxID=1917215 RepID=UPI001B443686|nr:TauD/TfdA family dioxygenase [Ferrovibrio sp.]MBP7063179.1 TauD/TfdA family dioxygenase [Ferrovibrio sp.]
MYHAIRNVEPATAFPGIEIHGLDLQQRLGEVALASLLDQWHQQPVLVFRNQHLSDSELLSFSHRLGQLDPAPDTKSNDPPAACLLYAREVPPDGGDIQFLNLQAAYETLPHETRRKIARLRLLHDNGLHDGGPGNWHPLVTSDPLSGRAALLLGSRRNTKVEGLDAVAAQALLNQLWQHATQPQFTLRHIWRPGDLVLWNNVSVMQRSEVVDPASSHQLRGIRLRRLYSSWERYAAYA